MRASHRRKGRQAGTGTDGASMLINLSFFFPMGLQAKKRARHGNNLVGYGMHETKVKE